MALGIRRLVISTFAAMVAASPALGEVRFVRASAPSGGDGASWASALSSLQAALQLAAAGDEIWVAAGTYTPGPPGDAISSFELRESVALYGGFAGTESQRSQRDPQANPSVLSGDVGFDDSTDPNPGLGWPQNYRLNTSNSGHVVTGHGVGAAATLDGFVVTQGAYGPAGTPAGDPLLTGSGLYAVGGSPTIRNCVFRYNLAAFGPGAAILLRDSNATISGCRFEHNYVHLGSGGAIYLGGGCRPTIADCEFVSNVVTSANGSEGQGGAIENRSSQPIVIERCVFESNEARPFSAGSYEIPRGGGVSSFGFEVPLVIRDCVFRYNRAAYGAGLFTWNPTTVVNCTFDHNTAFVYAGSGGASVGGDGAGIMCQWTDLTLINSTVAANTGQEAAGVYELSDPNSPTLGGSATIRNSIIWGNVANGQDVSPVDRQLKGNASVRYSCVQDLLTPIPGEDPPDPAHFPGCIVVDPRFESTSDLRLRADSPSIDAGSNSALPADVTTDLDGLARRYDDPGVADTGQGATPIVDMGAYERQPAPCPADLNSDGSIGLADLAILLAHFGTPSGAVRGDGDLDGDADVDLSDLAVLLGSFGLSC